MNPSNDLPSPMVNNSVVSDQDVNSNSPDQNNAGVNANITTNIDPVSSQGNIQQVSNAASTHAPQIADDVDLIEKEWVVKAKEIVAKTKDNPNLQSSELSKFKADYLKKRFNKDIKTSD